MQDFPDLAFLATYATLSLAAFAVLQQLVVPHTKLAAKNEVVSRHSD
jgi:hypothetical protein